MDQGGTPAGSQWFASMQSIDAVPEETARTGRAPGTDTTARRRGSRPEPRRRREPGKHGSHAVDTDTGKQRSRGKSLWSGPQRVGM